MPNIASAKKRVRLAREAGLRNSRLKTEFRNRVQQVVTISPSSEDRPEKLRQAISAIDRAAGAGAIHRRAADRRKSRLMRRLGQAGGATPDIKVARETKQKATSAKASVKSSTTKSRSVSGKSTAKKL